MVGVMDTVNKLLQLNDKRCYQKLKSVDREPERIGFLSEFCHRSLCEDEIIGDFGRT